MTGPTKDAILERIEELVNGLGIVVQNTPVAELGGILDDFASLISTHVDNAKLERDERTSIDDAESESDYIKSEYN